MGTLDASLAAYEAAFYLAAKQGYSAMSCDLFACNYVENTVMTEDFIGDPLGYTELQAGLNRWEDSQATVGIPDDMIRGAEACEEDL